MLTVSMQLWPRHPIDRFGLSCIFLMFVYFCIHRCGALVWIAWKEALMDLFTALCDWVISASILFDRAVLLEADGWPAQSRLILIPTRYAQYWICLVAFLWLCPLFLPQKILTGTLSPGSFGETLFRHSYSRYLTRVVNVWTYSKLCVLYLWRWTFRRSLNCVIEVTRLLF